MALKTKDFLKAPQLSLRYHQLHGYLNHHTLIWLMKHNGIQPPKDKHPILGYVSDELSPLALQNGIAIKNLYLINFGSIQFFRAFTLMAVNEDYAKPFLDISARYSFKLPSELLEAPSFAARPWNKVSSAEKQVVKNALQGNEHRLWLTSQEACQSLADNWDRKKSVANNLTMLTYNIVTKTFYDCEALSPQFYDSLNEFEQIWLNPEQFSVSAFNKIQKDFQEISIEALKNKLPQNRLPELKKDNDAVEKIFKHHADNKSYTKDRETFNAAALLSITGNLPRLMIILARHVLADPSLMQQVDCERERLKRVLENKSIAFDSQEAFNIILTQSELFMRIYYESLRFTMNIATVGDVFRFNTNFFTNGKGNWNITNEVTILPRTLAILPQQSTMMSEDKYAAPLNFNVDRAEYRFHKLEDGTIKSTSQPKVFGAPGSVRVCPGQFLTQKLFISLLWGMSEQQALRFKPGKKAQIIAMPDHSQSAHVSLENCLPKGAIVLLFAKKKDDNGTSNKRSTILLSTPSPITQRTNKL